MPALLPDLINEAVFDTTWIATGIEKGIFEAKQRWSTNSTQKFDQSTFNVSMSSSFSMQIPNGMELMDDSILTSADDSKQIASGRKFTLRLN
jgi:hypothetical protein